jgi:hypothetical protein
MTPQTFTISDRPFRKLRWAAARVIVLALVQAIKLTLRLLLVPENPTRVFLEGRLSESMPRATDALNVSPRCSVLVETTLGTTALAIAWSAIDGMTSAAIGPMDLIALLPSL